MLRQSLTAALVLSALYTAGCSATAGSPNTSNVSTGATGSGATGATGTGTGATGTGTGNNGSGGTTSIIVPVGGDGATGGSDGTNMAQQCNGLFKGYLRDFTIAPNTGTPDPKTGFPPPENAAVTPQIAETVAGVMYQVSPDFEVVLHNPAKQYANDPGMVQSQLGADQKPVYAGPAGGTISTTGPDNFKTWFNDTPSVNVGRELDLQFSPDPNKPSDPNAYTFASGMPSPSCTATDKTYCYGFYPIDGMQLGNEGQNHNYHMTFELHLKFKYHAGQVFTFKGDDDVWAFINNKLAVDLGGVHLNATASVSLDSLGLTEGSVYPLDFFWCERHVTASNFAIDTSLDIVDCGSPVVK